ncbi:MAG: FKBP-type peptidyl-prolyl cis-trans isomerase [Gammaproteobacteria bacterium]|nr:FKBP-type peptidyl-prolyl cis-trans isomerase [Gammaproteobacteria bacterium]
MKSKIAGIVLLGLLSTATWAAETNVAFKTEQDKVSYAIGLQMGQDFKRQGLTLNTGLFAQGLQDGLSAASGKMTEQQVQDTLTRFRKDLITKKQAEIKALAETNKKEGAKFLTDNKVKSGVVTLADGLQYKVLVAGKGAQPKEGDSITVNYSGKFLNGSEFDSSYKRGKPNVFVLSKELIPGWVEALKLMKAGSSWEVYVPANLGFGERGVGPIGPNQVLVFKIDLISVKPVVAAIKK